MCLTNSDNTAICETDPIMCFSNCQCCTYVILERKQLIIMSGRTRYYEWEVCEIEGHLGQNIRGEKWHVGVCLLVIGLSEHSIEKP